MNTATNIFKKIFPFRARPLSLADQTAAGQAPYQTGALQQPQQQNQPQVEESTGNQILSAVNAGLDGIGAIKSASQDEGSPLDAASARAMQQQIEFKNRQTSAMNAGKQVDSTGKQIDPTGQMTFFDASDLGLTPEFDVNNMTRQGLPKSGIETIIPDGREPMKQVGSAPRFDTKPVEDAITKTPYEIAQEKAAAAAAAPAEKQDLWKQILWVGLQAANSFLNPQDQTPIKRLGDAKKEKKIREANAELAPLEAIEQKKVKQAQELAKTRKANADYQGVILANEGKIRDNRSKESKLEYESIKADDVITPEEAEWFNSQYGENIQPYDASQYDVRYENGTPFSTKKKGTPDFAPVETLPIRQREIERQVTVGNTSGYEKSADAVKTALQVEKENFSRDTKIKTAEAKVEAQTQKQAAAASKKSEDYQKRELAAKANLAAAETELKNLEAIQLTEYDDPTKHDSKKAAIKAKVAKYKTELDGIRQQQPKAQPTGKKSKNKQGQVKPKADPLGIF